METSSVVRYLEHTPVSAFAFMPEPRVAARTFRDLLVWQKAHQFVLGVYSFTAAFPKPETYGLSLQMRRAAVSIPANIAEGFRRRGKADKARYMNIAEGSLEECRDYLILAYDLGYGHTDALNAALEETSRLLNAYSAAILICDFQSSRLFSPSAVFSRKLPRLKPARRLWPKSPTVQSGLSRRPG